MFIHAPRSKSQNAHRTQTLKNMRYEDSLRDRLASIQQYKHLMMRAEFARIRGSGGMIQQQPPLKFTKPQDEEDEALRGRRSRVKAILAHEERAISEELSEMSSKPRVSQMSGSPVSSSAERRAWLEDEARRLRVERGASRRMREIYEPRGSGRFREESESGSGSGRFREESESGSEPEPEPEPEDDDGPADPIDILRDHLHLVAKLREAERDRAEADMVDMNKRWLREEEDLQREQFEKRCVIYNTTTSQEVMGTSLDPKRSYGGSGDDDSREKTMLEVLVSERDAEEDRERRALRDAHRRQALAYVAHLREALDKQVLEELEAISVRCETEGGRTKRKDDNYDMRSWILERAARKT